MASHSADQHGHSAENLPSYDDINTPLVVMVGVISALLTLLTMMFVQGLYYHWEDRIHAKPEIIKTTTAEEIEKQKLVLQGAEAEKSIDQAMQSIVSKFKR